MSEENERRREKVIIMSLIVSLYMISHLQGWVADGRIRMRTRGLSSSPTETQCGVYQPIAMQ